MQITQKTSLLILCWITLGACSHSQKKPETPPESSTIPSSVVSAFDENPLRWRLVSDENDVQVYRDLQTSPGRVGLRGRMKLNVSIAKVATALTDFEVRKKWMDVLVENRVLRSTSEFERIEYAKLKAGFPYTYSDFIYKMTFSVLSAPKALLIHMASVSDDTVPVPADTARGQVTNSFNFVRERDANHSELVMEMGLDPKGALPSWDSQTAVVAWFNRTMLALKVTVENPRFKVSRAIQDYISQHH